MKNSIMLFIFFLIIPILSLGAGAEEAILDEAYWSDRAKIEQEFLNERDILRQQEFHFRKLIERELDKANRLKAEIEEKLKKNKTADVNTVALLRKVLDCLKLTIRIYTTFRYMPFAREAMDVADLLLTRYENPEKA